MTEAGKLTVETLEAAWQRAWRALTLEPSDIGPFEQVVAAYREGHRHYHTLQHLGECLEQFEPLRKLACEPAEVEIALWFHDAVYDVSRHDNEARSAAWAHASVIAAGVAIERAHRIGGLVLATRHDAPPASHDEALLVDVDLSILGAAPDRFDEYERQIRQEYAAVPETLFRARRRALLARLLDRASIYRTAPVRERLEAQARANLQRSLTALSGG